MMTTIQERLQRKREPLDKWSTREQLCLAFSVARSGDQNWMSVSRALKPFGDPNRPSDWFHQKNCAAQYGALLENVETPKRKKRTAAGVETAIETPSESILRKLISERKAELRRMMEEERREYARLQEEMALLKSGTVSEEQLDIWCREIDEEEQQKEKEAIAHAQWLKERELRKQEIERAWRPILKVTSPMQITGQKRKATDSIDSLLEVDSEQDRTPTQTPEPSKPTLSPLLTSLLKSPSHAQNVSTSSILHSAITNQRTINSNPNSTIASLLNTSTGIQVSPSLQQLVSTAISQEPMGNVMVKDAITDLLDVQDSLPHLKVEDIERTIPTGELPEIKHEEVDTIISNLIESADIVTDPEQHLLDGDIIKDFENELEELVNNEKAVQEAEAAKEVAAKCAELPRELPEVDPFEFQDEPEVYEPKMSSTLVKPIPLSQPVREPEISIVETVEDIEQSIKKEIIVEEPLEKDEHIPGSVEIVEVVVMEDEEISKDLDKSQIQSIVHSSTSESKNEEFEETKEIKLEKMDPEQEEIISETTSESLDELKTEPEETKDSVSIVDESTRRNTFTPEYSEDIFDDVIEVTKLDKSGKAKRDYSRTKKKEESELDILLAVEHAVSANLEDESESLSEKEEDKKGKQKVKIESERSNSSWTEEEDATARSRRRYSTPATPVDSVPNSPASSSANFDDDRDYRNWKKSIMLVYSRLTTHKYSSLFLKPITNEQAPGYHNIVRRPMDLHTIRRNVETGAIRTTVEFQRDVLLMFNNAIMYNKTDDTVYRMAQEMQAEGIDQIRILLQVQSEAPARRETRTSEAPGVKRKRTTEEHLKNKKRKDE